MNKIDATYNHYMKWWENPDINFNGDDFTIDYDSESGFKQNQPVDKPLRTTNEIVSYIDANDIQRKVQAEVKYYGMGHDPLWTIVVPDIVEAKDECVCESLL